MIPPTFVFYMAMILGTENSVMFFEDLCFLIHALILTRPSNGVLQYSFLDR
jgi:hypothetical protein